MKTFKTPKGTELPLLNLKGKDYLQVAHRIVWFREDHPHGRIITNPVRLEEKYSLFHAEILDESGKLLATAHKREDVTHFVDHIEKSETGAVGRALALCGYGTQFASEIEEGERLADAPTVPVRLVTAQNREVKDDSMRMVKSSGEKELGPNKKALFEFIKTNKFTADDVRRLGEKFFGKNALFTEDECAAIQSELTNELESRMRGK